MNPARFFHLSSYGCLTDSFQILRSKRTIDNLVGLINRVYFTSEPNLKVWVDSPIAKDAGFSIPISECIKSLTIRSALTEPPFCISKFTPFQQQLVFTLQSTKSKHVFINAATGTGKSLISLIHIITRFIEKHRSLSLSNVGKYSKPTWIIVLPTFQLVNQFGSWLELIIPAKHMNLFKTWCLIGTPKSLLESLVEEKWTSKYLEGILIDEADSILQPSSRYSPKKHAKKPSPGTSLLSTIMDLNVDQRLGSPVFPRLIIVSATLNCQIRNHLFAIGYLKGDTRDSIIQLEDEPLKHTPDLANENMKTLDKYALLPISQCKSRVRHLIYLTDDEAKEEEEQEAIMELQSKPTLVASLAMEHKYQRSVIHLFLPKTVSKSAFANGILKEYAEASLLNTSLPPIRVSYFTEQSASVDLSTTTILIGSSEDCRGIHCESLNTVIILGPIESITAYIHMARKGWKIFFSFADGATGRYFHTFYQRIRGFSSIANAFKKTITTTLSMVYRIAS